MFIRFLSLTQNGRKGLVIYCDKHHFIDLLDQFVANNVQLIEVTTI